MRSVSGAETERMQHFCFIPHDLVGRTSMMADNPVYHVEDKCWIALMHLRIWDGRQPGPMCQIYRSNSRYSTNCGRWSNKIRVRSSVTELASHLGQLDIEEELDVVTAAPRKPSRNDYVENQSRLQHSIVEHQTARISPVVDIRLWHDLSNTCHEHDITVEGDKPVCDIHLSYYPPTTAFFSCRAGIWYPSYITSQMRFGNPTSNPTMIFIMKSSRHNASWKFVPWSAECKRTSSCSTNLA